VKLSINRNLSLISIVTLALNVFPLDLKSTAAQEIPSIAKIVNSDKVKPAILDVKDLSLKDIVKFNWGFQGSLQGAGTPNEFGVGGFYPLSIKRNNVLFIDSQFNYNFSDLNSYTSLGEGINVEGGTVSTSTRLGYRWLNSNRSWMYGINAGYDSRPTKLPIDTVFFQQVALNLEAVSNKWFASGYWLVPIGEYGVNKNLNDFESTTNRDLNSIFPVDNLMVAGFDIGYNLTPNLKASAGYYYSESAVSKITDGGSARVKIEYTTVTGVTTGINITYDPAMHESWSAEDFNISANIKYRFGANNGSKIAKNKAQPELMPVIKALSASPANRDVLVHDFGGCWADNYDPSKGKWRGKFWSWNCRDGISEEWGAIKPYNSWRSYYTFVCGPRNGCDGHSDVPRPGSVWKRRVYSRPWSEGPIHSSHTLAGGGKDTGTWFYWEDFTPVCEKPGIRC